MEYIIYLYITQKLILEQTVNFSSDGQARAWACLGKKRNFENNTGDIPTIGGIIWYTLLFLPSDNIA